MRVRKTTSGTMKLLELREKLEDEGRGHQVNPEGIREDIVREELGIERINAFVRENDVSITRWKRTHTHIKPYNWRCEKCNCRLKSDMALVTMFEAYIESMGKRICCLSCYKKKKMLDGLDGKENKERVSILGGTGSGKSMWNSTMARDLW